MILTSRTQRAEQVPFSNAGTSFLETDVEGALLEVRKRISNNTTSTATTLNGTLNFNNTTDSVQVLTGTATGYSIVLPDATTLVNGHLFEIQNTSNQTITVKTFGGATLFTLSQTSIAFVRLQLNGTSAGTWLFYQIFLSSLASGILNYELSSSVLFTTTSTTDTLITGFSITPEAGTYATFVNMSVSASQASRIVGSSLYRAGVIIADSVREQSSSATNQKFIMSLLSIDAFNGSQSLDVRARISASTLSVFDRTILMIRLG